MKIKTLQNERLIFILITINIIIIFLHSFNYFHDFYYLFDIIDVLLTVFFSIEIGYTIFVKHVSFSSYFKNNWNKLDFISLVLSIPSVFILFNKDFEILSGFIALRSLRIFKTFRIIEFIPGGKKITKKILFAFKGVTFILFAFTLFTIVVSLITLSLFKNAAPQYFENAFESFFTIFKMFSGYGFSDVVSQIEMNSNQTITVFAKIYFILIVFLGSILGLSLINSVFINEMNSIVDEVEENTDNSIDELKNQIDDLRSKQVEILDKLNSLLENNKNK